MVKRSFWSGGGSAAVNVNLVYVNDLEVRVRRNLNPSRDPYWVCALYCYVNITRVGVNLTRYTTVPCYSLLRGRGLDCARIARHCPT